MNNNTIQEGKVYTFRKLNSTDMFLMFKVIKKIGIKEFADCFSNNDVQKLMSGKDKNVTAIGISVMLDLVDVVVGNLSKCESEIYELLSQTSNLTVDQIKELDIITFTVMVLDFVKKEEFKDFIKVVSESFKLAK